MTTNVTMIKQRTDQQKKTQKHATMNRITKTQTPHKKAKKSQTQHIKQQTQNV